MRVFYGFWYACKRTFQIAGPASAGCSCVHSFFVRRRRVPALRQRPEPEAHPGGRGGAAAAVPVVTAPVEVRTMPVTLNAVGTVEAISTVEVRAQVRVSCARSISRLARMSEKVSCCSRSIPGRLEAAVRQAEAVLARDTAQANDARAQRPRLESLLSRGLIPREQFDTQAASAAALEATMAADQAQVDQARLNLQYARISRADRPAAPARCTRTSATWCAPTTPTRSSRSTSCRRSMSPFRSRPGSSLEIRRYRPRHR